MLSQLIPPNNPIVFIVSPATILLIECVPDQTIRHSYGNRIIKYHDNEHVSIDKFYDRVRKNEYRRRMPESALAGRGKIHYALWKIIKKYVYCTRPAYARVEHREASARERGWGLPKCGRRVLPIRAVRKKNVFIIIRKAPAHLSVSGAIIFT